MSNNSQSFDADRHSFNHMYFRRDTGSISGGSSVGSNSGVTPCVPTRIQNVQTGAHAAEADLESMLDGWDTDQNARKQRAGDIKSSMVRRLGRLRTTDTYPQRTDHGFVHGTSSSASLRQFQADIPAVSITTSSTVTSNSYNSQVVHDATSLYDSVHTTTASIDGGASGRDHDFFAGFDLAGNSSSASCTTEPLSNNLYVPQPYASGSFPHMGGLSSAALSSFQQQQYMISPQVSSISPPHDGHNAAGSGTNTLVQPYHQPGGFRPQNATFQGTPNPSNLPDQDLTTLCHEEDTCGTSAEHGNPSKPKRPRMTTCLDLDGGIGRPSGTTTFPTHPVPDHFPLLSYQGVHSNLNPSMPPPFASDTGGATTNYSQAMYFAAKQDKELQIAELLTAERLMSAHRHAHHQAQLNELKALAAAPAKPAPVQSYAQYAEQSLNEIVIATHTGNNEDSQLVLREMCCAKTPDHYSKRPVRGLSSNGDDIWLSKFLQFLRSACCEVFEATAADVIERRKSKQILLGQVGIRCRFCAHLPHAVRSGRSACYPSSVDRIYQSVTMMIREHFPICDEFPDGVRKQYVALKKNTKKGEMESKLHWKNSARKMGMRDTEKGIFF